MLTLKIKMPLNVAWLVVLEVSVFSVVVFLNQYYQEIIQKEENIEGTQSLAVGGDIRYAESKATVTRSIYVMTCYIE